MGWGGRLKSSKGTSPGARSGEPAHPCAASMSSVPAVTLPQELALARSEIARQSLLLAAMVAETERFRAEAAALSQSRLDGLASISHDLRTPLNAVIGFSEAMQRELFGPLGHERYRDYAVHIRDSGEQLLKATEAMLAQARSGEPRPWTAPDRE
mgnify:CR=1 FL=1